ncbi:hypothetical protein E2C01_102251 [Portunus trituberculatus]|uniref:Uncharacterized protein n=1 Tax=Portunus trituberculatus TaxID=210409 RepID=A0A5B7KI22_PORTR|nr:hypothetical protein [Portunus trituberculatus]
MTSLRPFTIHGCRPPPTNTRTSSVICGSGGRVLGMIGGELMMLVVEEVEEEEDGGGGGGGGGGGATAASKGGDGVVDKMVSVGSGRRPRVDSNPTTYHLETLKYLHVTMISRF